MNTTTATATATATATTNDSSSFEIDQDVIDWLLDGDVSIQYQVYRDLLGGQEEEKQQDLRQKIALEGWGKQYLDAYNPTIGHWGDGFYQPKWISSHYTLLDLRHLCVMPTTIINNTITKILMEEKSNIDGGIDCHNHLNGHNSKYNSDICVNGMFLYYACYFGVDSEDKELHSIIDFILNEQMDDGGFNCRSNRGNPKSSSVHTTLSILEGFAEYEKQQQHQHNYRIAEIQKASKDGWEFLLRHQLYISVHKNPGQIINERFLKFPFPTRWYYDILRALDYWQYANLPWDDRLQLSIDFLLSKRGTKASTRGKWNSNSKYNGLIHFEMEKAGKPSRWNTLRALRVLKHYHNTKQQQQQQQKNLAKTAITTTTTKRKDSNDDDDTSPYTKRGKRRRRKKAAA